MLSDAATVSQAGRLNNNSVSFMFQSDRGNHTAVPIVHALSLKLTLRYLTNHRRLHAHLGVPPVAAFSHITMQQGRAAAFASATLAAARFSELSTIVCMYTNSAFSIVPDESVSTMSNSTSAV